MDHQEKEYITAKDLATRLDVSFKSIEKWTAQRRIPCVKVGYHWRYPIIEINKRLNSGQLLSPVKKKGGSYE
jgi:excisionase family DNA binding protein